MIKPIKLEGIWNEGFVQPIYVIAEAIASYCDIGYSNNILKNLSNVSAKDMPKSERNMSGMIEVLKKAKRDCNILLIDDLFDTGSTAMECVRKLKEDPLIGEVYLLAITKTRK